MKTRLKEYTIKQFEWDKDTIISLVKIIYDDGTISYTILKRSKIGIPTSLHEYWLNKTDAERLYMLYKNKTLDFSKDEYIKRLWDKISNLNYEIEKLEETIKELEEKGDK